MYPFDPLEAVHNNDISEEEILDLKSRYGYSREFAMRKIKARLLFLELTNMKHRMGDYEKASDRDVIDRLIEIIMYGIEE